MGKRRSRILMGKESGSPRLPGDDIVVLISSGARLSVTTRQQDIVALTSGNRAQVAILLNGEVGIHVHRSNRTVKGTMYQARYAILKNIVAPVVLADGMDESDLALNQ
ncbi:hypothetical protein GGX14DRAFT_407505 [Mycena pura]|uniref:Uncharacterized protein n=1 Tax=Mycena pura TaxID=153505 RepID=A0AAD6UR62_9AGAR|nr:hypothetical protein GGX14DRAFT_407505 [Mycena pura]